MDEQNKINEENYGAKSMDDDNPVLTLADILNEQDEMEEVCHRDIFNLRFQIVSTCRHFINFVHFLCFSRA